MDGKKLSAKTITGIVVGCVILLLVVVVALASFTTIPEGYMGMKYQLGKIVDTGLEPGLPVQDPLCPEDCAGGYAGAGV